MSASEKVTEIFRELAGDDAERLAATRFLADVNSRITTSIARSQEKADILAADHIGFHLIDWQADAAFIVALSLYPERFTDEDIREGIESFLWHAPAHVLAAARLSGIAITDLAANEEPNPPPEPTG